MNAIAPETPEAAEKRRLADQWYENSGDNYEENIKSLGGVFGKDFAPEKLGKIPKNIKRSIIEDYNEMKEEIDSSEETFDYNDTIEVLSMQSNLSKEKVDLIISEYNNEKELVENGQNINTDGKLSAQGGLEGNLNLPESTTPLINETGGKVTDILNNKETEQVKGGVNGVKDRIKENLNLDNIQFNEKISNKEKNISDAKEVFFNKEQVLEYSQNPKSNNSKTDNLKALGESIIEGEKINDPDLIDILGNFVIETGGKSIKDYSNNNKDIVNEALNNAFELQIEKVKDGKVNYKTEKVERLKNEILDNELTNPLEKLERFKELKDEIDTSIGSLAKKREKSTIGKEKNELEKEKKQLQKEYMNLNKNPEKNSDKLKAIEERAKEIEKSLNNKAKSGSIESLGGGKNEVINSNIEKVN